MFGKDQEATTPVSTGDSRGTSILAQGCSFKGEVEIQGVFRVEGELLPYCLPHRRNNGP